MKAECLPFSQIPHTTPLFVDYLAHHPKIQQFLSRSPRFADWFQDEAHRINYDSMRREKAVFRETEYPVPASWRVLYHRTHPIQRLFFEALYETPRT